MNVIAASKRCGFPSEAGSKPHKAALEGEFIYGSDSSCKAQKETIPRKNKTPKKEGRRNPWRRRERKGEVRPAVAGVRLPVSSLTRPSRRSAVRCRRVVCGCGGERACAWQSESWKEEAMPLLQKSDVVK
jgi:hypothetical protein